MKPVSMPSMSAVPVPVARWVARLRWWSLYAAVRSSILMFGCAASYFAYRS
jgi:hypothetical protein